MTAGGSEPTGSSVTGVSLPRMPKGAAFEELVCALFHCAGFYVEKNIIERATDQVLELDAVITDYSADTLVPQLLEAKAGKWGFSDLFKVFGWMTYLGIESGFFIGQESPDHFDFFQQKSKELSIRLLVAPAAEQPQGVPGEIGCPPSAVRDDVPIWRFSGWLERAILKRLNGKKRSAPGTKRYVALDTYYNQLNSDIFFSRTEGERIRRLFSTFQKWPHISAKCGNEMCGGGFDDEAVAVPADVFADTYYKCSYTDIQLSTYVEHRARLAILKNAVEATVNGTSLDGLPPTFRLGLDEISRQRSFRRYPVFWQWFLWAFGGFLLPDLLEREYQLLASRTGVPPDDIPDALAAYDRLFPSGAGWFADMSPRSRVRFIKMFPVPFAGLGAHYRKRLYVPGKQLKELPVTGTHTREDLARWANLTVDVLRAGSA